MQKCLFTAWDIRRVLFPWTQRANKQEQVPCSAAQACLSREHCAQKKLCLLARSQGLLLDLLLQPLNDSITNTFLWKVAELFLNPLTHSCNQSIAWPRVCQDLWGNPPPTQLGFCSSLIGMARCSALITQRCVHCAYYLAHMCPQGCGEHLAVWGADKAANIAHSGGSVLHKEHVRTVQDFTADLLKCTSITLHPGRGCFLPLLLYLHLPWS